MNEGGCIALSERRPSLGYFGKILEQVTALNQLLSQVNIDIIFHQITYSHNVWMVNRLQHSKLLLHQSSIDIPLINLLLLNDLDGTELLDFQILGQVDFTKLACTKLFLKAVDHLNLGYPVEAFKVLKFI